MLSIVEKALFLKSIDLFSQIPSEDLAQVALFAQEERVESGARIFVKGDAGELLYVVVEGSVRVEGDATSSKLGPRQSFGEMAILDARPRSATVTAVGPTRLLKISRDDFQELLSDQPEVAKGVIRSLTKWVK
jgi:CRP-like cAMP-binding protein